MTTKSTPIGYRYHLPTGQNLLPLLEQPYISAAILRDLLRRRGSFCPSTEKKDLVAKLLLSYLSPLEFDYLMTIAIERESGRKVRNDYDELETNTGLTLAESLPTDDQFKISRDFPSEDHHFSIIGSPSLKQISDTHYQINYLIRRRNLHSNWIKSEQQFNGTVDVFKDDKKEVLRFEAWHTSDETRKVNRFITRSLRKSCKESGLIKENTTKTIRFNSFNNEQRIAFLLKFTGSFGNEIFSFEKLVDLSLKVDESSDPKDERISWMKRKVSKLNVSGTELENTFFVTDKTCRPHLLFWRFECRYKFDTADGDGTMIAAFEFGGYSKNQSGTSPFQITCVRLSASRYRGNYKTLERKIIARLNSYQMEFADAAIHPPTGGSS